MRITYSKNSWEDYTSWLTEDTSMVKRINELIRDIQITPFEGKGNPEPLKFDLAGFWPRKIYREHRLVYQVRDYEILIFSCRYHYDK
jgi:toxin YoeB